MRFTRIALLGTALAGLALPALAETRIGVTMTSFDNPHLTVLLDAMREEAARHEGVTLVTEDAQLDVARQLNQVQNFAANGLDAIIVNAVDGDSTAAITAQARDAGIPLVYVNHPPAELDAGMPEGSAYVGSAERDAGRFQAEAVCQMMDGTGRALILMGPLENRAALVRTQTVEEIFANDDCGIEVVEKQTANWNRVQAVDLVSAWVTAGLEFDAIVSNNDEMAIGAIQALKSAGMSMDDVVIAGIDATADGLAAMAAGDLDVTVFQNTVGQGHLAVQAAVSAAGGAAMEPEAWVPFEAVTAENLSQYAN